jgi:hypothetical protein
MIGQAHGVSSLFECVKKIEKRIVARELCHFPPEDDARVVKPGAWNVATR